MWAGKSQDLQALCGKERLAAGYIARGKCFPVLASLLGQGEAEVSGYSFHLHRAPGEDGMR